MKNKLKEIKARTFLLRATKQVSETGQVRGRKESEDITREVKS